MTGWTLTPKAAADIDSIWDFSAERWGIGQADIYVREIAEAFVPLANGAVTARSATDIRRDYWRHNIGSHIIFFRRSAAQRIVIVRILHQRMDADRHL